LRQVLVAGGDHDSASPERTAVGMQDVSVTVRFEPNHPDPFAYGGVRGAFL
jgi:hypothetical protein